MSCIYVVAAGSKGYVDTIIYWEIDNIIIIIIHDGAETLISTLIY